MSHRRWRYSPDDRAVIYPTWPTCDRVEPGSAMNVQILIDSVVRQVTVLIAQLATSGGIRAPVAHLANQVFVELANELSAQGISRKVSADMFGMALRAYIRKLRRLSEGRTEQGKTLWQAILEFIRGEGMVPRSRVLERFRNDEELQVSAIIHDLVDSGLVFGSGTGDLSIYRAATDEELGELSRMSTRDGSDELISAIVFRTGPLPKEELAEYFTRSPGVFEGGLARLLADGRVRRLEDGRLHAQDFRIPRGSTQGWEAAVFDHLQAVVQTICQRLRASTGSEGPDWIGGSTYTYDVWPGHPLEGEVQAQLEGIRKRCGDLRASVSAYNEKHGVPSSYQQVSTYVGQCAIERELGEDGSAGDGRAEGSSDAVA